MFFFLLLDSYFNMVSVCHLVRVLLVLNSPYKVFIFLTLELVPSFVLYVLPASSEGLKSLLIVSSCSFCSKCCPLVSQPLVLLLHSVSLFFILAPTLKKRQSDMTNSSGFTIRFFHQSYDIDTIKTEIK